MTSSSDVLFRAESCLTEVYSKFKKIQMSDAEKVKGAILEVYPTLLAFPKSSSSVVIPD